MKYNLFFSNGGEVGPYENLSAAANDAKSYILGDKSNSLNNIELRPCNSLARGGYSRFNQNSLFLDKHNLVDFIEDNGETGIPLVIK